MIATMAMAVVLAHAGHAEPSANRREVTEAIVIEASESEVWKIVGDVEDSNWIENVDTTLVQGGDPESSTRTLTLRNGRTIVEKGRSYDADHRSFAFDVTERDLRDLPADKYSATISVKPADGGHATVEWRAAFAPLAAGSDEASEKAIRAWTHASLATLKTKVEKGRKI
jgi:hypothetical protein